MKYEQKQSDNQKTDTNWHRYNRNTGNNNCDRSKARTSKNRDLSLAPPGIEPKGTRDRMHNRNWKSQVIHENSTRQCNISGILSRLQVEPDTNNPSTQPVRCYSNSTPSTTAESRWRRLRRVDAWARHSASRLFTFESNLVWTFLLHSSYLSFDSETVMPASIDAVSCMIVEKGRRFSWWKSPEWVCGPFGGIQRKIPTVINPTAPG